MSNHTESYLINDIIKIFDKYEVFEFLGKEKTLKLLLEIKDLGSERDCNDDEILYKIGNKLKLCYECWQYTDKLDIGRCEKCNLKYAKK
jgi:hypothetical protein